MKTLVYLIICFFLLIPVAQAQHSSGAGGTYDSGGRLRVTNEGVLTSSADSVAVTDAPTVAACKTYTINAKGTAGAPITIDNTAGGITVADAATDRCSLVIYNVGATNPMYCASGALAPTGTVGIPLAAGEHRDLGVAGQEVWKCFSTAGTTAAVLEAKP